jgi:hypothetical protein
MSVRAEKPTGATSNETLFRATSQSPSVSITQ